MSIVTLDSKTDALFTGKNQKIMINLSDIKEAANKLNSISDKVSNSKSYIRTDYITGELSEAYSKCGDNTKELLDDLEFFTKSLSTVVQTAYNIYESTNEEEYNELENLIAYLFDVYEDSFSKISDGDITAPSTLETLLITTEEYMRSFNEMNILFDEQYATLIEDFRNKLLIQYQNFLAKNVPTVLNSMVEDIYQWNAKDQHGSDRYKEGLDDFKNNFTNNVNEKYNINNYDVNNTNIPEDLWNNASDYEKAILLLTYSGDFNGLQDTFEKIISNSFNDQYVISNNIPTLDKTFNLLKLANDFYTRDFTGDINSDDPEAALRKILSEYNNMFNSGYLLPGDYSLTSEMLNQVDASDSDKAKAWYESLKELGYLKNVNSDYSPEDIYQSTNNCEFLLELLKTKGETGIRDMYSNYYRKLGVSPEEGQIYLDNFFSYDYRGGITTLNNLLIYDGIVDGLKGPVDELCNDKLALDASKQNYKMGLLNTLDTTSTTDEDVAKAKDNLGNNAKYLEDWQIKAYALLYSIDPKYAELLLTDTLYYNIESGKGYDAAKAQIYQMTGEDIKKFARELIKDDVLAGIFGDILGGYSGTINTITSGLYDGLEGSVEGVGEFFEGVLDTIGIASSEDRMNANDYRKSYLQQFLSGNFDLMDPESDKEFFDFLNSKKTQLGITRIEYNLSSSVGNMVIPMLLSSFVSPAAMSTWMFMSVSGNEKKQMLIEGREKDANMYLEAGAKGLVAVLSERMLGALKGYGAKESDILSVFKNYDKYSNFGKFIASTLSNQVNEVGEELFENACNYVLDYVFEGKTPDAGNVINETWETAYMTFLSTPIINFMGTTFQNSDYSTINRKTSHNINGIEATYSQSELLKFVDNKGELDRNGFMDFLRTNGRLSKIELSPSMVQDFNVRGVSGVYYDNNKQQYIIEYNDGHTENTDCIVKLNDTYYTKEQSDTYEEALAKFSSTSELDTNTRVKYTDEQIQNVRNNILGLATNDEELSIYMVLADGLVKQMQRGNPYVNDAYNNIVKLVKGNGLKLEYWNYQSQYADPYNAIEFNNIDELTLRTILHEFAHAMHYRLDRVNDKANIPVFNETDHNYYVTIGGKQYNYSSATESARTKLQNGSYELFNDYAMDKLLQDSQAYMDKVLAEQGTTFDAEVEKKVSEYREKMNDPSFETKIKDILWRENVSTVTDAELIRAAQTELLKPYKMEILNQSDNYTIIRCLSDIVDSVMGGVHDYSLIGLHGEGYYGGQELHDVVVTKKGDDGIGHQYAETVAQVMPLLQLAPETAPLLYEMFGVEYMNMIMAEINVINSSGGNNG